MASTTGGWIAVLSLLIHAASSQPDPSCPTVQLPDSGCIFNNCTSLTCAVHTADPSPMPVGSLTFVVYPCSDPVSVLVDAQNLLSAETRRNFVRSETVYLSSVGFGLDVNMSRNATFLDLEISSPGTPTNATPTPVVPRLLIPLTPDSCMCDSLRQLAGNTTHTVVIPTCSANENCTGVRCMVNVFGDVFYIENIALPCEEAVELVVENSQLQPIFTTVFNESGRRALLVNGVPITVDVTIEPRDFAMDVAAVVTDPLFGRVQIFPRHTIILDRTHCSRPDFVTLPPPPAPTPLPMPSVNSSPTCLGFYDAIRRNFSEPLICRFLEDSCDLGVNCSLLITNAEYVLSVRYVTALGKFAFLVSDDSGRSLGTGVGVGVSVDLPYPPNSTVSFIQRSIAAGVRGFQIDLRTTLQGRAILDNLIPFSHIPLIEEQCQALVQAALDPSTRCVPNGDCSGLNCDLEPGLAEEYDVVFSVNKCVDPVSVNMTIFHGGLSQQVVEQSQRIYLGGSQSLAVQMSRNATDLNFAAYITDSAQSDTTEPRPVIPEVLVPLNASHCMCQSLVALAAVSGHSVIETNCIAVANCRSMRCQLNILLSAYYVELEVSACENAVYIYVENGRFEVLHRSRFDRSGVQDFVVEGLPLTLNVTLTARDYSLLIAATLEDPIFGPVEIIPRHVIILDRTNCDHSDFNTIAPPTSATPPPNPDPDSSATCMALYELIVTLLAEPFTCKLQSSCDRGLECRLAILDTGYNVTLSLTGTSLSLAVRDMRGAVLGQGASDVVNVSLPKPQDSNLTLTQSYDAETETLSLKLDLYVFALSGEQRQDVLIPYTEIPVEDTSGNTGRSRAVVASVVVLLLLTCVALLVVFVILAIVFSRRRSRVKTSFDFKPMSHSELEEKDLENYLDTPQGAFPSMRTGVITSLESNGMSGGGRGLREGEFEDVDLHQSSGGGQNGTKKGTLV